MKQHFVDATGVNRVVFAEEPQQQQQPPQPRPRPCAVIEKAELERAEVTDRESSDSSLAEVEMEAVSDSCSSEVEIAEVDPTRVGNVVASAEIPKSVLPEMLRVKDHFEG